MVQTLEDDLLHNADHFLSSTQKSKKCLEIYGYFLLLMLFSQQVRKDLEQKRQREERRIQAILQDSPPPPWSPPNKTIPFGK